MTRFIPIFLFLFSLAIAGGDDELPLRAKGGASDGRTILFYGNSMVERLLEHGELEARLQIAEPNAGLKIRSLAWTGDEVGNRLRLEGYAKHMKNLIAKWPAGTLVLGYGFYESFAGAEGLAEFEEQYRTHLDQLALIHPGAEIVMLSPLASESASDERNADLELYAKSIKKLAAEVDADFVDLFSATRDAFAATESELTSRGIHLNDAGNHIVAKVIAEALSGTSEVDPKHLREVALAASAKHERVAEVVRPKNAVVYFGVRARPDEYADEMPRYHEMIRLTEAVVHQLAAKPGTTFSEMEVPNLDPMPEGKGRDDGDRTGIIKSVAEAMAEFEVDENFELNLFASEEEFPELRNPVQIAFDASGRLWVVTMPSFPHTVPGLTPPDKILILEDTDKDGKADKVTTWMEGLDALDGVAFHHDGVIISEQPRLWMTRDTNGDNQVDSQVELLRGIDVTDSHHGGMIASGPGGDVIFSDGVFHRSQLETPFGVHRGIDATTYRLDPISGKINTEWQHTTPNPWNVTFDRYGSVFQMYGDGGVFDGTALPWTPVGAYHPFKYAQIASYGKGSGTAIVSSPNFPDRYQQGMASASLLGRYAVNLTAFDYSEGMIQAADPLKVISSPNAAFRPADVEFGMDGALYVSDFCSPIIGHAQHPMRDPHWDHDYGRIWRVVHKGKSLVTEWPKIEGAPPNELCDLLTHTQDLVRHHARIELRKHGREGIAAVDQWMGKTDRTNPDFDQAALEAVFVSAGLNEARPALLDELLNSESFHFRGAAVHQIRLQADQLDNVPELLSKMATDEHPRVQIEVIGAIAHLRQTNPNLTQILNLITSDNKNVQSTLRALDYGTEPVKGRSVPVLEVDERSELTHWFRYGPAGAGKAVLHTSKNPSGGALHLFRTFFESEKAQPAIIGISHKSLDIFVNGSLKFSQNSIWSGDQQVQIELQPGVNVIEVELKKAKMGRSADGLPPVYLYDPVGRALDNATYLTTPEKLTQLTAAYDRERKERGTILRVTAAPGLQFAPKTLRAEPGAKVRIVFENPDIMMHNFLLLAPGSVAEIGALADKMAAEADAIEKHYIPDSDKVLISSKLLGPQASEELVFNAPEEPGNYPYICTFPGHWRIMQGVLTVAEYKPEPASVPVTKSRAFTKKIGEGVMFETSPNVAGFKTLVPPTKTAGKVIANQKTNNDDIKVLTDGKLREGFGPIFGNGIKDGAYQMDLGNSQPVAAITSWSHNRNGKRGAQTVSLYGSNHSTDPGWNLADKERFKPLGTISTDGQKVDEFAALSLRAKDGQTLGDFRWIVWQVAPVTTIHENTAFQELAVEVASPSPEPASAKKPVSARIGGKPNVILIMTDDQGYGDLACHGNPVVKTPNIDQLYAESIRFTDFHVSSFCTPTRAALMTGRHPGRTGAYRTSSGRTLLHTDEKTIANVFSEGGYRTGMIGKWHLGDNAPHRPQDRGFQDVVWHRCGGVGQASDYWGNTYFDDTYERNGNFEKFEGYCTDIWFSESIRFVEENQEQPFFLYIAPNAPHGPYRVDRKWSDPYRNEIPWGGGPEFYGMVENIDHNVGLLRSKLEELGLTENTIFIFMTDNGTANGAKFEGLTSEAKQGYNAGMRGKKSSIYEGGHRVPFFIHWPKGNLTGGRDVSSVSAHIDVLPTLAELCDIPVPKTHNPDGISFAKLLKDPKAPPHRDHHIVQYQGGPYFRGAPAKWEYTCVLKDDWRLIDGKELYDLRKDSAQQNDIAAAHPGIVEELRALYPPFWESVSPRMTPVSIDLGNPAENPTVLCSQDWYMPTGNPPWNFAEIKRLPRRTGPWYVDVKTAGRYKITLRQFPVEADMPVKAVRAKIQIAGKEMESKVESGSKGVVFKLDLPAGKTKLVTYLYDETGKPGGAYFTEVEAL